MVTHFFSQTSMISDVGNNIRLIFVIAIYCLMAAILEYGYHSRKIQYVINLCEKTSPVVLTRTDNYHLPKISILMN